MNVHDPQRKGPKKFRRENPHEPGHDDKCYPAGVQDLDHAPVKKLPGGERAMVDHTRRDAVFSASFQRVGVGVVGEYNADFRIQPSGLDMIDQRLKI